LTTAIIISL